MYAIKASAMRMHTAERDAMRREGRQAGSLFLQGAMLLLGESSETVYRSVVASGYWWFKC